MHIYATTGCWRGEFVKNALVTSITAQLKKSIIIAPNLVDKVRLQIAIVKNCISLFQTMTSTYNLVRTGSLTSQQEEGLQMFLKPAR